MKITRTILSIFVTLLFLGVTALNAPGTESRSIKRNSSGGGEKKTALVIGNGAYTKKPLKNPENDARDIAAALKNLGFEVHLELNADRRGMEDAIRAFGKKLRGGGVGLFYYAGHGMQVDGKNYLLPIGGIISDEADVPYEAVRADRVLAKMKSARNSLNMVFLDACRDNPFRSEFRSTSSQGLAEMKAAKGALIAYATAPGSVAADGSGGKNGLYTRYLLKYIGQPGITVEKMLKKVRQAVSRDTGDKQVPWESSSMVGDFYFSGVPQGKVPPVAGAQPTFSTPRYSINAEEELWQTVKEGGELPDFEYFLGEYPQSPFARVARLKIRKLRQAALRSTLTIQTVPADATIKILNIRDKYHSGMAVSPGSYKITVSSPGYKAVTKSFEVPPSEEFIYPVKLISLGPKAGDIYTDPTTGMEFIYIAGGCYQMGSPSHEVGRGDDEGPVHKVCVDGFYMSKYEVTNQQYRLYQSSHNSKDFEGQSLNGDSQPAVYVSWNDAKGYANWLSGKGEKPYRLPSEAEWEYAARAETTTARYWGDDPATACGYGNVRDRALKRVFDWSGIHNCDDGHAVSAPVGGFRPNNFGLYDMLGNIWEWTGDWYGKNYYSSSASRNPRGPSSDSYRVFRGGSWFNFPEFVRSANRFWVVPGFRYRDLGFRLVFPEGSRSSQSK